MWLCQHFNVWECCKVEDIWTPEPLGSSGKSWQLESADRQVIKKAAVGFMCSAKKSAELPAVWFSSLLPLHTNTGAIISAKSKWAPLAGEILYCLKRSKHSEFSSPFTLMSRVTFERSGRDTNGSNSRKKSAAVFFFSRTHVQRLLS